MHTRVRARRAHHWQPAAAVLLLGLIAWLAPNPLPWRSPFQHRPAAPAQQLELAIGAGAIGRTEGAPAASPAPAPPTTAKPAPPAAPIVPPTFRGQWRGNGINFLTGDAFAAVVAFPPSSPGSVVATADFPTYGCREVWQLAQAGPKTLTLQATLAAGPCLRRPLRVQVSLVDAAHLYVQWRLVDARVESEAQLTKV